MKSKGFTLVELLITLVIMGLIMSIAGYNYNQYSQFWNKRLGNFEREQAVMRSKLQLRDTLDSMAPYIVKDNKGGWVHYFLGRDDGLTFVSYAPIFSEEGGASVVRIFSEEYNSGKFRLVYEEAPLRNTLLQSTEQVLNFQYRLIVASELSSVSFSYYGWPNRGSKYGINEDSTVKPSWTSEYDGKLTKLQPEKVKIISDFINFNINVTPGDKKLLNLFLEDDI